MSMQPNHVRNFISFLYYHFFIFFYIIFHKFPGNVSGCWIENIFFFDLWTFLQFLSHRHNIASLSLLCFHRKCFDKLHYFVVKVWIGFTKTHHAMYTGVNHPHSLCILLERRKFHLDIFLRAVEQTPMKVLPQRL